MATPVQPPADLWCARCGHGWLAHTPGGGACLVWSADPAWRCACAGFLYVPADPPDRGAPARMG